ncbi:c-type cytochrome [Flavobacterium branchiicola]|uniref:C-type cytochrome n=1 Tax=Flavobacterium branchiicola TaxID=1114875 RepID=A0ABV9PLB5_9FLAO|nr:c-type cytochrome [Flavobacterium branchiicola]MBS7256650.1 cytochrome c [Flavobacterium branchiicola]
MKKIRFILLSSIAVIILLSGIIIYKMNTVSENPEIVTTNTMFCGNPDLTINQEKGKIIFDSNCVACHKLNSKSTGPPLHETDSIVFINWLTDKKHKIDSTKVEILAIDYHKTMFSKTLKKEDVSFLIEYCHSK